MNLPRTRFIAQNLRHILLLAFLIVSFTPGFAVTKYWRYVLSGLPNADWHEPTNWQPAGIPTASDLVIFDGGDITSCNVWLNATCAGIVIDTGFNSLNPAFGQVLIRNNSTFTVGGNGATLQDGILDGGTGTIYLNGHLLFEGGTYLATTGTTYLAGNFTGYTMNPNHFQPRGGTFVFYGSISATFDVNGSEAFDDVIIQKTNSYPIEVQNGETMEIFGSLTCNDGYLASQTLTAWIKAYGDVTVNPNFDTGNTSIRFSGPNDAHFILNKSGRTFSRIYLDKALLSDTVYFEGPAGILYTGVGADSLIIQNATLKFPANPNVDLDFGNILIRNQGRMLAPDGTLYLSGNLHIVNGNDFSFQPQMGTVQIDGLTAGIYLSGISKETFHNLTFAKTNGYPWYIGVGNTIEVTNKASFNDGIITATSGNPELCILDTAIVNPNFDAGTAHLYFKGSGTSTWIVNKPGHTFSDIFINKSTGDTVHTILNAGALGTYSDQLWIQEGIMDFPQNSTVDMDFVDLTIEPGGSLISPSGTLYFQGNFTNQGGSFLHNNGTFVFNGSTSTLFDGFVEEIFWNLTLLKTNGFAQTVAAGDTLSILNQLNCNEGLFDGSGYLHARKDVFVHPNYDLGGINFAFTGSGNGNFLHDRNGMTFNDVRVRKDNSNDTIFFQRSTGVLYAGTSGSDLNVVRGNVSFDIPSSVYFDYGNLYIHPQGTFTSYSGYLYSSGNFRNLGGQFNHNFGTFAPYSSTFNYYEGAPDDDFWDFNLLKTNGYPYVISNADSINILDHIILTEGSLQGPGWVNALKDVTVTPNYDGGNINFRFTGPGNANFQHERNGYTFTNVLIDKANPGDTVFVSRASGVLYFGDGSSNLNLNRGTVAFNIPSSVYMDYANLYIHPQGTFTAHSGYLYSSGNLRNLGGQFNHNFGTFAPYSSTFNLYDGVPEDDFWDFNLLKTNGYPYVISNADSINILDHIILTEGSLQGPGWVNALKDVTVSPDYDGGNINFRFTGPGNAIFQHERNGYTFTNVLIDKANPGDTVFVSRASGVLYFGDGSSNLNLNRGTVAFNIPSSVYMDYANVYIHPQGVFTAHSGYLYSSGNLRNLGGQFNHNFGTFAPYSSTFNLYDGVPEDDFWDFNLLKTNGYPYVISNADSINILDHIYLTEGSLQGPGWVNALKDVTVSPNYDGGNINLRFTGPGNAIFNHERNGYTFTNVLVDKTNPGDTVFVSRTSGVLYFGDGSSNLNLNRGTVAFDIPSSMYMDYANVYIHPQGIFTAHSGTLYSSGNFVNLGGQFAHNQGTFAPYGSSSNFYDGIPGDFFWDVSIQKTSGFSYTISSGDSMAVLNQLFLTDGFVPGEVFNTFGDVTVSPNWDGGTARILFSGPADQNLSVSGTYNLNSDLVINKSGTGKVSLTSPLWMDHSGQELILEHGLLETSLTNLLTLTDGITITGGDSLSFISGPVQKYGDDAFRFPIGKEGYFGPLWMSAPALTSHAFRAEYFHSDPDAAGFLRANKAMSLSHVSACEYWNFDRTAGTSQVYVSLSYDDMRSCGTETPADLVVSRWDGANWTDEGQSGLTDSTLTTAAPVSAYSPFTLASTSGLNSLFPQEFCGKDSYEPNNTILDAKNLFGGVIAGIKEMRICGRLDKDWFYFDLNHPATIRIRLEDLPADYDVRLLDGNATLLQKSELNGLTNEYIQQNNQPPGRYYIRVNGKNGAWDIDEGYTLIVSTQIPAPPGGVGTKPPVQAQIFKTLAGDQDQLRVFPNPASDRLTVEMDLSREASVGLNLMDLTGRIVRNRSEDLPEGLSQIELNLEGLAAGAYELHIRAGNETLHRKVLRVK